MQRGMTGEAGTFTAQVVDGWTSYGVVCMGENGNSSTCMRDASAAVALTGLAGKVTEVRGGRPGRVRR